MYSAHRVSFIFLLSLQWSPRNKLTSQGSLPLLTASSASCSYGACFFRGHNSSTKKEPSSAQESEVKNRLCPGETTLDVGPVPTAPLSWPTFLRPLLLLQPQQCLRQTAQCRPPLPRDRVQEFKDGGERNISQD